MGSSVRTYPFALKKTNANESNAKAQIFATWKVIFLQGAKT